MFSHVSHCLIQVKVLNVPSLTHPKVKLTVDLATGHLVVAKITGKEMNEDVQLLTHDKGMK